MTATTVAIASTAFASARRSAGQLPYLSQLAHYWPAESLAEFTLLMAAKGHCVNSFMMLGSREYAIDKLSCAHALDDDGLRVLAVQMFSYFDDEPCHAVAQLVSQPLTH